MENRDNSRIGSMYGSNDNDTYSEISMMSGNSRKRLNSNGNVKGRPSLANVVEDKRVQRLIFKTL